MKKFSVSASDPYDILIGSDILKNCGEYIKEVMPGCKLCIITDSNVNSLYAQVVMSSLMESGFQTSKIVFPAGEHSKNLSTFANIVEALAEEGITKSDAIIALGGGVVGDMTGFIASSYLRGIRYVQIPTTLLAAVDSSVGGKTGVNLPMGKNLAGTYWQPSLVICDYKTLDTLSRSGLNDGAASALKSAVISDDSLVPYILSGDYEYIIHRCVSIKKSLVEADELDKGVQQIMSFGKTVGHAIEKISSYSISHGAAIAKGMIIESRAAYKLGLTDTDISGQLEDIMNLLGIDTSLNFVPEDLYRIILNDDKIYKGYISVVVPKYLGRCELHKIPVSKLKDYVYEGLS